MKDSNGTSNAKRDPWTWMRWAREQMSQSPDLSEAGEYQAHIGEKHLLLVLASYADAEGVTYVSQKQLALDCGLKLRERKTKNHKGKEIVETVLPSVLGIRLRSLREKGLIEVVPNSHGRKNRGNTYRLINTHATEGVAHTRHRGGVDAQHTCHSTPGTTNTKEQPQSEPPISLSSSVSSLEIPRARARCLQGEEQKKAKEGNTDQVEAFPQEDSSVGKNEVEGEDVGLTATEHTRSGMGVDPEADGDPVATGVPACPFMRFPDRATTGAGV